MQEDGRSGGTLYDADAEHMVDVSVGEPDRPEGPSARVQLGEEHGGFLAGIDEDGFSRRGVGHQPAVLHELPIRQLDDLEVRHRPARRGS
jgi:hypothetical protein